MFIHGFSSSAHWSRKVQRKIWILAFFLASAADLVPALWIEFRYYTIPLYFMNSIPILVIIKAGFSWDLYI
ncbi:hypothetical protein CMV_006421 [Castanea mollissima]|uniref:Dol-P-Glc:Glc(2)Man(9)GlcNAc(2)-PP-Dol alpha-1,2-glucosyltransferase n=1 Tax=Castanea mollissima TaxID=60419 RepID=A0A8J4VR87_9ROSI|nr:hypothetical protein CMV_006421 [Castanea mollissima]